METVEIQSGKKKELGEASKQDTEQETIRKALDEGKKIMKGVALGLCQ